MEKDHSKLLDYEHLKSICKEPCGFPGSAAALEQGAQFYQGERAAKGLGSDLELGAGFAP